MGYEWWSIIQEKRYENMLSKITILMSKLVSTFAHETREIADETSFFVCSRNECSRDEFVFLLTKRVLTKRALTKRVFLFAHEMSAHETSFFLLTKRVFFYSRNEFELVSAEHCKKKLF